MRIYKMSPKSPWILVWWYIVFSGRKKSKRLYGFLQKRSHLLEKKQLLKYLVLIFYKYHHWVPKREFTVFHCAPSVEALMVYRKPAIETWLVPTVHDTKNIHLGERTSLFINRNRTNNSYTFSSPPLKFGWSNIKPPIKGLTQFSCFLFQLQYFYLFALM